MKWNTFEGVWIDHDSQMNQVFVRKNILKIVRTLYIAEEQQQLPFSNVYLVYFQEADAKIMQKATVISLAKR